MCKFPRGVARFDPSAELALFRTLQECLTNIHRHSGSKTAAIKIEADDDRLALEVRDQGKGIEPETLGEWFGNKRRTGVGISGMRERMKDLGGTLEIQSSSAGTVVRATIPGAPESGRSSPRTAAPPAEPSKAAPPRAKALASARSNPGIRPGSGAPCGTSYFSGEQHAKFKRATSCCISGISRKCFSVSRRMIAAALLRGIASR